MSVFAIISAALSAAEAAGGELQGLWAAAPMRRLAHGAVERCSVEPMGGESRFAVVLVAGQVYTADLQSVPRGVRTLVSLFDPAGELIGCHGGWGRVRLIQSAPTTGTYTLSVEIGPGAEAFALRLAPLTADEVERAIEDPLYVI